MTDREPGAPDDALPADETTGEPFPDEELPGDDGTFQDANPDDAADDDAEAEEAEAAAEEDEANEAEAAADDEDEYEDEEGAEEPLVVPARGGRGGAAAAEARRGGPAGPSVAERAVHLEDRASAIFVLAIVATFVGILLYGMLAGGDGFFTPLPTPSPTPTEEPIPSDEPSESPSASPSDLAIGIAVGLAGCLGFGHAVRIARCAIGAQRLAVRGPDGRALGFAVRVTLGLSPTVRRRPGPVGILGRP